MLVTDLFVAHTRKRQRHHDPVDKFSLLSSNPYDPSKQIEKVIAVKYVTRCIIVPRPM